MPMMGTIIEAPSLKTSWAVATQALLMAMMSPAQNQNHQATSSACAGINANVAPSCFNNGNRPDHKHQCCIENSQSDNNNVGGGAPISQAPPVGDGSIAKRASSASNNNSKCVAVPRKSY
ncbi:hypothetical protein NL676_028230 [Syzygium grande]|nr:hypothetical protein NL676_028230 [Syzygium grande]